MQPKNMRSWIELALFTGLLFLLAAIPYTIYLKASTKQPAVVIIPNTASSEKIHHTQTSPVLLSTPSASTTTTCLPAPGEDIASDATPAAYLFPSSPAKLCYPPQLPPYPFTWQPYHNYQQKYSIDVPSNWINKTTTAQGTLVHIFSETSTASSSTNPTISFAWYSGQDPLASDAAYIKKPIVRSGLPGTVYTRYTNGILAIFPLRNGYLLLQGTTDDDGFYAFEHMLDSLQVSK